MPFYSSLSPFPDYCGVPMNVSPERVDNPLMINPFTSSNSPFSVYDEAPSNVASERVELPS